MRAPVDIAIDAAVATVTLNDPPALNAIGFEMAQELRAAFDRLAGNEAVHVVLLRGAGANFSAGGNLRDALRITQEEEQGAVRFMAGFNALIRTVFNFPKPIVGMAHGSAAGGALGLLLCADIVLLGRSARLMQAFIHVALAPDCGTSTLLARRVGIGKAKELTLTGRQVLAEEALQLGLGDALHDDDDLHAQALQLARVIASRSPTATAQSKCLLQRAQLMSLDDALDLEAEVQVALLQREDFRERATAFINRSK